MALTNESLPLFALDVDVLLLKPPPKWKVMKPFARPLDMANIDAEYMAIQLKKVAVVCLLCDYEIWRLQLAEKVIEPACYNYLIRTSCKAEFEMFRDRFFPHTIHSNIPQRLWKGEYNDVYEYPEGDWLSVFNSIREEIIF